MGTATARAWGRRAVRVMTAAVVTMLVASVRCPAEPASAAAPGSAHPAATGWCAAWATGLLPATETVAARHGAVQGFADQTFREVVHVSAGGNAVRLRLANVFGRAPLVVGAVTVGREHAGAAVDAAAPVLFDGRRSVAIPAGGEVTSDAVPFALEGGTDLAVSMFFPLPTGPVAWHDFALQTSFESAAWSGDHTADSSAATFSHAVETWYVLSAVDVHAGTGHAAVVAFGDSITDGFPSPPGANNRWPDLLASRLQDAGLPLSVVDAGIGGNRLLSDEPRYGGPNGVSRFERDALSQTAARAVILLEGINDVFAGATAASIISAMRTIIAEAHAAGVRVLGGTLTPICRTGGREIVRRAVNTFIRTSQAFDGTVDFDRALANPTKPTCLATKLDSGDHVHPSAAGYAAMARAVDLDRLAAVASVRLPVTTSWWAPAVALGAIIAAGVVAGVAFRRRQQRGSAVEQHGRRHAAGDRGAS